MTLRAWAWPLPLSSKLCTNYANVAHAAKRSKRATKEKINKACGRRKRRRWRREHKKCYSIIYGVLCIVFCQRTDNLPVVKACDLSLLATFASQTWAEAEAEAWAWVGGRNTSPCGGFGWQMSTAADDIQAQAGLAKTPVALLTK